MMKQSICLLVLGLALGGMGCGNDDDTPQIEVGFTARCDPLAPDYCAFPWPSNFYTRPDSTTETGLRVDFGEWSLPRNRDNKPVDPSKFNVYDGFTTAPQILTYFPGGVDRANLPPEDDIERSLDADATTVLINMESGEKVLHFAEVDMRREEPDQQAFIIRPMVWLDWATTYAVGIRNVKLLNGDPVPVSPTFEAYRDSLETGIPEQEARREDMEEVFAAIENVGWARSELQLAWSFTVGSENSLAGSLPALYEEAMNVIKTDDEIPWEVDNVEENVNEDIATRITGRVRLPLYLTTSYEGSELLPGGELNRDAEGNPLQNGYTWQVPVLINIPHSVADGTFEGRFMVYGHGLLGSNGECNSGWNRSQAQEYGYVLVCTDWWGLADADEGFIGNQVLPDLSNFYKITERLHQGVLNTALMSEFIERTLRNDPRFASGGVPVTNMMEGVYYYGNSQGGIMGQAAVALDRNIERAVFGVPGVAYSYLIPRSLDFAALDPVMSDWYPNNLDWELGIAIAQMLWDGVEPTGHVRRLYQNPLPDNTPKIVMYHPGIGDAQVDTRTIDITARTIDLPQLAPVVMSVPGVREVEAPYDGSAVVYYDPGLETRPIGNAYPPGDAGTHEAVRRSTPARKQINDFLRPDGVINQYCDGPCDDPDCYPY